VQPRQIDVNKIKQPELVKSKRRRQTGPSRDKSRGAGLLEVLIAVLILAIGMLGMAALQANALKNSGSSFERTQAVIQAYAMLDAMRSNPASARAGGYLLPEACNVPTDSASLVQADQRQWIQALKDNINSTACGTIGCVAAVCTVTISWDDSRAGVVNPNNDSKRTFSTTTRI
jgi:type IV pilus assembly protein PilV